MTDVQAWVAGRMAAYAVPRHVRVVETIPATAQARSTNGPFELWSSGRLRSVPLPDLLIAATAERHRVGVLHCEENQP